MEKGNGRWSFVVRIWDTVSPSLICTMPSKPNILVTNAPNSITIKEICNSKTPYLRWLHRRACQAVAQKLRIKKKLQKIEKRIVIDYFPCHRRPLRLLDKSCGSQQDHIMHQQYQCYLPRGEHCFQGGAYFFSCADISFQLFYDLSVILLKHST